MTDRTTAKSRRRRDGHAIPVHALRHALLAQLVGGLSALLLALVLRRWAGVDLAGMIILLALLQGGLAALVSVLQAAPPWWRFIHMAFMPLVVALHGLAIAPGWYLAGFLLLLAIFWRTDQSRVPLYLSNRATTAALLDQLPLTPVCILDLGCGEGSLLRRLAGARPDCHFVGIEHAPLPWLVARIITLGLANVTLRRSDFWSESLADYDIVYAFLSPAPMQRLWHKACAEMTMDATLISNSFPVPDVTPTQINEVGDRRRTRLYSYHPGKTHDSGAYSTHPQCRNHQ